MLRFFKFRYLIWSTRNFYKPSSRNTLGGTLRHAIIHVSSYVFGCLPVFFAYATFGVIVFSQHNESVWYYVLLILYCSLNHLAQHVFFYLVHIVHILFVTRTKGLLNGDEILDTFDELNSSYPQNWVPEIYFYTFIAFSSKEINSYKP